MLQLIRPGQVANEAVERAAIALLEAESVDGIAGILVETCLTHSQGVRGFVFLEVEGSMTLAGVRPQMSIADARRADLYSCVRQASTLGMATTFVDIPSAFEGIAVFVTALVQPLRQRSETVGALYVEYDGCRPD